MTFDKFTIKAQEAIQEAVNLVQARGQQAIEPVHVMQGVMKVGENVTNFIFQKLGTCWPVSSKWGKTSRISSFRNWVSTAGKSNRYWKARSLRCQRCRGANPT